MTDTNTDMTTDTDADTDIKMKPYKVTIYFHSPDDGTAFETVCDLEEYGFPQECAVSIRYSTVLQDGTNNRYIIPGKQVDGFDADTNAAKDGWGDPKELTIEQ